jgi:hypothetical protein
MLFQTRNVFLFSLSNWIKVPGSILLHLSSLLFIVPLCCSDKHPFIIKNLSVESFYCARSFTGADISEDGQSVCAIQPYSANDMDASHDFSQPVLLTADQIISISQEMKLSTDLLKNMEKIQYLPHAFGDEDIFVSELVWLKNSEKLKILYALRGGYNDPTVKFICMANTDGSDEDRIYAADYALGNLSCSNDGKSVVFLSPSAHSDNIYRLDIDGERKPIIIAKAAGSGKIVDAHCSPANPSVVYVMDVGGIDNVYRVSLDGSRTDQLTNFTDPSTKIFGAAESYDGRNIAICMKYEKDDVSYALYLLNSATGEVGRLMPSVETVLLDDSEEKVVKVSSWHYPRWSPDNFTILVNSVEKLDRFSHLPVGAYQITSYFWELTLVELRE